MKTAYFAAIGLFAIVSVTFLPSNSRAASAAELEQSARAALRDLYSANPEAKIVANKARAVLVFPRILKAGFMVAAQRGDGVLLVNERVAGYYNTVSASYGFQAGVQKFGYAMFFMNDASLNYLRKSRGWEVGTAQDQTSVKPDLDCAGARSGMSDRSALAICHLLLGASLKRAHRCLDDCQFAWV
jgi:lipid-binding SYLF domain-containing protein